MAAGSADPPASNMPEASTDMAFDAPRSYGADDLIRRLATSGVLGDAVLKRVDTHAAHVLLTADRAWKLKRRVRYDYLDFSTPERRREALERELELNLRTAPKLYLGLHRISTSSTGQLELDGPGMAVDWMLEMRRFADGDLLAAVAQRGDLVPDLVMAAADEIVRLHAAAAVSIGSGADRLERVITGNAVCLSRTRLGMEDDEIERLVSRQRSELSRHAALLDTRAACGRMRRCHGDLHLANVAVLDGAPVLFDCLEFSEELATVDVLYDTAFLIMDLLRVGLPTAASMLANRYVDLSPEDEAGWTLLPLFMSLRAAIRAHVRASAGDTNDASDYLRLASTVLADEPARLIAIGGGSGAGKSTLARHIASAFGPRPGARVLRSDVLRKRLAGVPPETRLPQDSYTPEAGGMVYDHMFALAEEHLRRGSSVILDAAFLNPTERAEAEALAVAAGVRFSGLWLSVGENERIHRLETRHKDASDADAKVAAAQASRLTDVPPTWAVLDAHRSLDTVTHDAEVAIQGAKRC